MGPSIPRMSSSCSPICRLASSSARRQTTWHVYAVPFPPSRNSRDFSTYRQIVVDACGGLSARTEDAAFRGLVHAGVVTTSIPSIAGQLAADFTQPKGMQALGILYEMASPESVFGY